MTRKIKNVIKKTMVLVLSILTSFFITLQISETSNVKKVYGDGYSGDLYNPSYGSSFMNIDPSVANPSNYVSFSEFMEVTYGETQFVNGKIVITSPGIFTDEIITNEEQVVLDQYSQKKIVIGSADELYYFSYLCHMQYKNNNSNGNINIPRNYYMSLYYVLGDDIDYVDASRYMRLFIPVGDSVSKFTGTFDGQGFTITNLFLKPIESSDVYEESYGGLEYYSFFSETSSNAIIKDFGLINPTIIQTIAFNQMFYTSYVVGRNYGLVDHVYVIDDRGNSSGISAEGGFFISGLVSKNYGTFTNAYYSSRLISSTSVTEKTGSNPIIIDNFGSMSHVYFDRSILNEEFTVCSSNNACDVTNGYIIDATVSNFDPSTIVYNNTLIGLSTSQFQNETYFKSDNWFNNTSYGTSAQMRLHDTYPILKGFYYNSTYDAYEITDATDLVYMISIFSKASYYRNQKYILVNNLDMDQIGPKAYKGGETAFSGVLTSLPIKINETQYITNRGQNYNYPYYAIFNLKINVGSAFGNIYSYGLFAYLSGKIENIAIVNAEISPLDASANDFNYSIGIVAGKLLNGRISNVHVSGNITLKTKASTNAIGKISVGGLVGQGSGMIINSSASGIINGEVHEANNYMNSSSIGGLIGLSDNIIVTGSRSVINISGISFTSANAITQNITTYVGGLIGTGTTSDFNTSHNDGSITINENGFYNGNLYVGGIIGKLTQANAIISEITNRGKITVNFTNFGTKTYLMTTRISGVMSVQSALRNPEFYGVGNTGNIEIKNKNISSSEFTNTNASIDVKVAGVINANSTHIISKGLHNSGNITGDLAIISGVTGVISAENSTSTVYTDLSKSYNSGNLTLTTSNVITHHDIFVSGIAFGKYMVLDNLRNTGNISIKISHSSTLSLNASGSYKTFKVVGNFEEVSLNRNIANCYNEGKINLITENITDNSFKFNTYVSGICYKNDNRAIYSDASEESITANISKSGSLDNVLNTGEIYVNTYIYGMCVASGITSMNASLITNAFNIANIYVRNEGFAPSGDWGGSLFETAACGISYLLLNRYAQIKDSANAGSITAIEEVNTATNILASGIAGRNDVSETGATISNTSNNHFAKVMFAINYGQILAWNNAEASPTAPEQLTQGWFGLWSGGSNYEAKTKATGILASGVMSTVNVINYGNIYSPTLASGIFGYINVNLFTVSANQTYVANTINYGNIRRIIAKPSTTTSTGSFTAGNTTYYFTPSSSNLNNYFLGGAIGNIRTKENISGLSAFLEIFSTESFNINFSYLINFDQLIDMVGFNIKSASFSAVNALITTNSNDTSAEPFESLKPYAFSDAPATQTTNMGIFSSDFPLKNPPDTPEFKGIETNELIPEYISFIPYNKVNGKIRDIVFGTNVSEQNQNIYGIYALASTQGVVNGQYIPENFNWSGIDPEIGGEADSSWRGEEGNNLTIIFSGKMNQLSQSVSTAIFDLELVSTTDSTIKLKKPVIDLKNSTLTYYVSKNSKEYLTGWTSGELEQVILGKQKTKTEYVLASANNYNFGGVSNITNIRILHGTDIIKEDTTYYKNPVTVAETKIKNESNTLGRLILKNSGTNNYVPVGDYLLSGSSYVDIYDKYYAGTLDVEFISHTPYTISGFLQTHYFYQSKGSIIQKGLDQSIAKNFDILQPTSVTTWFSSSTYQLAFTSGTVVNKTNGPYSAKDSNFYVYAGARTDYAKTYVLVQYTYLDLSDPESEVIFVPNEKSAYKTNYNDGYKLAYGANLVQMDYNKETYSDWKDNLAYVPRYSGEFKSLTNGENLGKITVMAQDGETTSTYTIQIEYVEAQSIKDLDAVYVNNVALSPDWVLAGNQTGTTPNSIYDPVTKKWYIDQKNGYNGILGNEDKVNNEWVEIPDQKITNHWIFDSTTNKYYVDQPIYNGTLGNEDKVDGSFVLAVPQSSTTEHAIYDLQTGNYYLDQPVYNNILGVEDMVTNRWTNASKQDGSTLNSIYDSKTKTWYLDQPVSYNNILGDEDKINGSWVLADKQDGTTLYSIYDSTTTKWYLDQPVSYNGILDEEDKSYQYVLADVKNYIYSSSNGKWYLDQPVSYDGVLDEKDRVFQWVIADAQDGSTPHSIYDSATEIYYLDQPTTNGKLGDEDQVNGSWVLADYQDGTSLNTIYDNKTKKYYVDQIVSYNGVLGDEDKKVVVTSSTSSEIYYEIPSSIGKVNYKPGTNHLGSIRLSFKVYNFRDKTDLSDIITLYRYDSRTGQKVLVPLMNGDIINYTLIGGVVTNDNKNFDNLNKSWSYGTLDFELSLSQDLQGGLYYVYVSLGTDESTDYYIAFTKMKSPEPIVTELEYDGNSIIPEYENLDDETNSNRFITSYTSYIEFGKHYLEGVTDKSMYFDDLRTIVDVYYNEITGNNLPDYLTKLRISQYSTIESITFSLDSSSTASHHRYIITYTILAEDGLTRGTFIHYIEEMNVDVKIKETFINGNTVDAQNKVSFAREEAPLIHVEYGLTDIYNWQYFSCTSSNQTLEDSMYYINVDESFGFEIIFVEELDPGDYTFTLKYSALNVLIYEGNPSITSDDIYVSYNIVFEILEVTKKKNENSYLEAVKFVTDVIFTGLNTIIDNNLITPATYQNYLVNEQARKIVSLPSGIYYNEYKANNNRFWVIGQVQKTNLDSYMPTFTLPIGALVYRVEIGYLESANQDGTTAHSIYDSVTEKYYLDQPLPNLVLGDEDKVNGAWIIASSQDGTTPNSIYDFDTNKWYIDQAVYDGKLGKEDRIKEYLKGNGTIDSEDLRFDFNPLDEDNFNYVTYRVFAEAYIEGDETYGNMYTDYIVSVQDVSFNVKFDIVVEKDDSFNVNLNSEQLVVHISFVNYESGYVIDKNGNSVYVPYKDDTHIRTAMSMFSYLTSKDNKQVFINNQFSTTQAGYYRIDIELPDNLTYELSFASSTIVVDEDNKGFMVQASVIPKKYLLKIIIKANGNQSVDWGQHQETMDKYPL